MVDNPDTDNQSLIPVDGDITNIPTSLLADMPRFGPGVLHMEVICEVGGKGYPVEIRRDSVPPYTDGWKFAPLGGQVG